MRSTSVLPGKDGKYSTHDIHSVICGDIEAEKLRKTREEADKIAMENERTRGKLVEVEAVYRFYESVFVSLRARILSSELTDESKDELLKDLQRLLGKIADAGVTDSAHSAADPAAES